MDEEKIYILGYSDYECFNAVKAYRSKDIAEYVAKEINHHMQSILDVAEIYHFAIAHHTYGKYNDNWDKLSEVEQETLHKSTVEFEKRCLQEVVNKFGKRYVNEHILSMINFDNIGKHSCMHFSVNEVILI